MAGKDSGNGGGISVTPDTLRSKKAEIDEIDAWLDSVSGTAGGGKRALSNKFAKAVTEDENLKATADSVVSQVVDFLNAQTPEVRAGIFSLLNKSLDEKIGKEVDDFLTKMAEQNKPEQVSANEDEISQKREERAKRVKEFGALQGILEMFGRGDEIADIEAPKSLRGVPKGTKRGPRAINLMKWTVDGTEVSADQGTISGVASLVGMKAKEFKAALTEAGVDTKKPENFDVTVNGHKVTGTKQAEATEEAPAA